MDKTRILILAVLLLGGGYYYFGVKNKDKTYVVKGTKDLSCTRMSSGNTCHGQIIYKDGDREKTGNITNETVVILEKTGEKDGALLYLADKIPFNAKIDFGLTYIKEIKIANE